MNTGAREALDTSPRNALLVRALRVLQAAARHPGRRSAQDLAAEAGLPRSTGARLVATLAAAGVLERREPGGWVLGGELVRLAQRVEPHAELRRAARPSLARLADLTRESTMVIVPYGLAAIETLEQVDGPYLLGARNWLGRLYHLHASSAGKLVLAGLSRAELEQRYAGVRLERSTARTATDVDALWDALERVRKRGHGESLDELEDGLTTLATPVHGPDGRLAAILGVSGPSLRLGASRRATIVGLMHEDSRRIEAALAGS